MLDPVIEKQLEKALSDLRRLKSHNPDGEHPDHPTEVWRVAVERGKTRAGYWTWVRERVVASYVDLDEG